MDLNIKLEKKHVYSGAGNIFSKLVLAKDLLLKNKSFLIVVENESRLLTYVKISQFVGVKIEKLNTLSDFTNLAFNNFGNFITTKDFFSLNIPKLDKFKKNYTLEIKRGLSVSPQDLAKKLSELNFTFSEYEDKNTFHISGDTLNFIDSTGQILKVGFWGDEIDDLWFGKDKIDNYVFGFNQALNNFELSREINKDLIEIFGESEIFTILDSIDFYSDFDEIFPKLNNFLVFLALGKTDNGELKTEKNLGFKDLTINNLEDFKSLLSSKLEKKYIVTKNKKVILNFLDLNNLDDVEVIETKLNNLKSFSFPKGLVICDDNISRIFIKKRIKKSLSENLDLLMQIKKGDYVVHIDHGVGIFNEIVEKEIGGVKKEYLMIEYKNNDKLFVPITEVSRLSRYVGLENPKLTSLSTKDWEKKLKKASEDVNKIAQELLEIYAKRKLQKGFKFISRKDLENQFFNSFEFVYTDDQYSVINDIYKDMESDFPMDRLLSGDVGFGKTEVAFAAIFKAIENGKQAVLISPLVVLAYEHFESAKKRFANFPFNIEVLTRFEKPGVVRDILKKLKQGKIDLVIGTHRLLSSDVEFKDLGLLVVDEEHKFGVKDKEKIKTFKGNIDILSMSATPIPRSLNMALNGLKEVSMLTIPPTGKQSIETIVTPFDDEVIFRAAKKEFERGGQIFFIHNRVETITGMQAYLENLLPGKKIIVTHGQLPGDMLEKRIIAFKKGEYDILLATTVIENGIDFQNVNTIFINDANNFGISQIHQLRGRVGRAEKKAYAYLLFKKDKIKEDAAKRLKTMVDYSHLGAGFELAVKDLEIRGGGDILGIKQSGTSQEIGINLFLEMLEDKIEELKIQNSFDEAKKDKQKRINVTIDLNIEAYLPNDFFTSELDKLNFYRELESIRNIEDLENIVSSFREINPKMEKSSLNLFDLIKLKILASKYKISSIKKVGINYQVDFEEDVTLEELRNFLELDKEVKFFVVTVKRLRTAVKNFTNDEKFVKYLLGLKLRT